MALFADYFDLAAMDMGQVIQGDGSAPVTRLDFHRHGELCMAASADGRLRIIDALEGRERASARCAQFGVGAARFTHHETSLVHASNPDKGALGDAAQLHALRYVSLHDNKYVRWFHGHADLVRALALSPTDDRLLSAAGGADRTVRLWDLGHARCLGRARLPDQAQAPQCAFSPDGIIFAVAYADAAQRAQVVKLFDSRRAEAGPFATFALDARALGFGALDALAQTAPVAAARLRHPLALGHAQLCDLAFAPDGNSLLAPLDVGAALVVDAYSGAVSAALPGGAGASGSHEAHVAFGACFTPDSKKALLGTEDGGLVAWALDSGRPVGRVLGHVGPTLQVACSPKHEVIASGCSNVVLWIGPGDGDPAAAPAMSGA